MPDLELYKKQAAQAALDLVHDTMALGLGTGSTANHFIDGLAERLNDGRLRGICGVPTSIATMTRAQRLGIPLTTLEQHPRLDLAFDGADEIDPRFDLIKGLGGALLREKIVAASAARFIIMGDSTKQVDQLGLRTPVPVEIVHFALPLCERRLTDLGGVPVLRRAPDGSIYRTDEGHVILDTQFAGIADATALAAAIRAIVGVVEHGLFIGMASGIITAGPAGVRAQGHFE